MGDGRTESLIRLLVVAPAVALRVGLRAVFGAIPGVVVTGEAASIHEVEEAAQEADLVVVAGEMGDFDHLLERLAQPDLGLPVLLLVARGSIRREKLLRLKHQPWGLLPWDASEEELAAAVQGLSVGLVVASPEYLVNLVSRQGEVDEQELPEGEALTAREAEVLQYLAQGLANKQVAKALGISEHTVKYHVSAIYTKLGATNRTEAVRQGVRRGLIVL